MTTTLEIGREELFNDCHSLVVRDEACGQYHYVGVVVLTDKTRYLGVPAETSADALMLIEILAWRISWTEEPGGLQSLRSQRNRHN